MSTAEMVRTYVTAPAITPVQERLEDVVEAKLKASPYSAVRDVRCRVRERLLTLHGKMPNYYCVQMAISLARANVSDDIIVRNCLQVIYKSQ